MTSSQEFDRHRQTYRSDIDKAVAFSGQSHDFFTRVKADYLIDLIQRFAATRSATDAAPLSVLDIGCGHGHIHPYLTGSNANIKLTAIDVAATVIEEARATNPGIDYDVYDGAHLPYQDNSFEVAYTIAVMHHVPPPRWPAFLDEMRRVVRPGGLVVVFEHNPLNPLTWWIVRTCPIDENAVLLRKGKLSALVRCAGFTRIQGSYILFLPLNGPRYRSFDRKIDWLPIGAQYYVSARVPD